MVFGEKLKELRERMGLTQEELGTKINQKKANISKYENGKLQPSLETIDLLANIFNVSIDELLGRKNYLIKEEQATYLDLEVEREIQAFQEKGINIDRKSAQEIVNHRRLLIAGKEKCIEYIFEAKTLADALLRIAEFQSDLKFDDATFSELVIRARDKYGLPGGVGGIAAHGPSYPGSGVLDNEDNN